MYEIEKNAILQHCRKSLYIQSCNLEQKSGSAYSVNEAFLHFLLLTVFSKVAMSYKMRKFKITQNRTLDEKC